MEAPGDAPQAEAAGFDALLAEVEPVDEEAHELAPAGAQTAEPFGECDYDSLTVTQIAALARMRIADERRREEVLRVKQVNAVWEKQQAAYAKLVAAAEAAGLPPPENKHAQKPRGPRSTLPASGYHGVVMKSVHCFQSKATFQGKLIFIGSFTTAEGAARACDICQRNLEGNREADGPRTQYNFPSDDIAAAAVAFAEQRVERSFLGRGRGHADPALAASLPLPGAAAAAGDEGEEEEEGEEEDEAARGAAAPKKRAPGPPAQKACQACGTLMMTRIRKCPSCRTTCESSKTMYKGVRLRRAQTRAEPPSESGFHIQQRVNAAEAEEGEVPRFQAFLWADKVNHYLGTFHTAIEAAFAFDKAAFLRWGVEDAVALNKSNWRTEEEGRAAVASALAGVDRSARKTIVRKKTRKADAFFPPAAVIDGEQPGSEEDGEGVPLPPPRSHKAKKRPAAPPPPPAADVGEGEEGGAVKKPRGRSGAGWDFFQGAGGGGKAAATAEGVVVPKPPGRAGAHASSPTHVPMLMAHEVEAVAAAVMAPVPGPVVVPQGEGALFASLGL